MRWSETLDNVSSYAYLDDDLIIVFALRRAQSAPSRLRFCLCGVRLDMTDEIRKKVKSCQLLCQTKIQTPIVPQRTADPARSHIASNSCRSRAKKAKPCSRANKLPP